MLRANEGNRVCPRCLALKDTIVGYSDESGVTLPPLHPRCRCAIKYEEEPENYRRTEPELTYKPVSEERYQQLIIPLRKMGVTIMRGEEAEKHLDFMNAEASNFGTDVVFFRKKVSVSAILEETHHIRQNRQGMNDDKKEPLRSWLNEIDAKKYLLRVAKEYGIPRVEVETTKKQLAQYEKMVRENSDLSKVIKEWSPQNNDKYILYLDEELPSKVYSNYRIAGVIYKPISMSHTNGKCIAVQGGGSFVGREVELVD